MALMLPDRQEFCVLRCGLLCCGLWPGAPASARAHRRRRAASLERLCTVVRGLVEAVLSTCRPKIFALISKAHSCKQESCKEAGSFLVRLVGVWW